MSRRVGRVTRAFARVQEIISEYLNAGYNPTTHEILQAYYRDQYDPDSSSQYDTIYQCIRRGRRLAIKKWEEYLRTRGFWADLQRALIHMGEEIEESTRSEEWRDYIANLTERSVISDDVLELLPALEFLFEQKMYQFSEEGTNFIISIGDPFRRQSRWYRPSRSGWNIRELDLYKRTLKTINTQIERGIVTHVITGSGDSLRRVLKYTQPIVASLEDGTSWVCNHCSSRNIGEANFCAICGHPRE